VKRKIKMTLEPRSIGAAIKELQEYKKALERKKNLLIEKLVERGVEIAKELAPEDFGDLKNSIQGRTADGKGIIFTDMPYAGFVEFGFGVEGAGSPHPHPEISVQYDVNSHGDEGWLYFDVKRGKVRWSKGQPSKPFMYNTALRLRDEAPKIAKEVFRGDK